MKWSETTAAECRYGEVAEKIWGDWEILWEDSESDYQGHATILAKKDGRFSFYEWWYGSCSGCDTWEDENLSDDDIEAEMKQTALWFDSEDELRKWLTMLESPISNYVPNRGRLADGGYFLLERINAVKAALGMEEYKPKEKV